jgi:hypothetical protein
MYQTPGYIETPEPLLMFQLYSDLRDTFGSGLNSQIDECFAKLGRDTTRVSKLSLVDVCDMVELVKDELGKKVLGILFTRLLNQMGRLDQTIQVPTYIIDPSAHIDQVAMCLLGTILMTPITGPSSGEPVVWLRHVKQAIQVHVQTQIAKLALYGQQKERITRLASHLTWRLREGGQLSEREKTFLMHMLTTRYTRNGISPVYPIKGLDEELEQGKKVERKGEKEDTAPEEQISPWVLNTLDEIYSVYQEGPKDKYLSMDSNRSLEMLLGFICPIPNSVVLTAGYKTEYNFFDVLNLEEVMKMDFSPETQLTGVAQRAISPTVYGGSELSSAQKDNVKILTSPTFDVVIDHGKIGNGYEIPYVPDTPNVNLTWQRNRVEMVYSSAIRKRPLMLLSSGEVVIDSFVTMPSSRMGLVGNLSLDRYEVMSDYMLEKVRQEASDWGINLPFFNVFKPKMDVWFSRREGKTYEIKDIELDMTNYYKIWGDVQIKPALSEFVKPTKEELWKEDVDLSNYIRYRLALTDSEWFRSKNTITLCANWYKTESLLGGEINYTDGEGKRLELEDMAKITLGGLK